VPALSIVELSEDDDSATFSTVDKMGRVRTAGYKGGTPYRKFLVARVFRCYGTILWKRCE